MSVTINSVGVKTLKRDLTLRFALLLSIFLILLVVSHIISSIVISEKEYDGILLNTAGRQRMLIRQYASEVNQVLVGLAASDLEMVLSEKKKVDLTAKIYDKTYQAFVHGGEINTDISGEHVMVIPALKNKKIRSHLKRVDEEWRELKRISLLSLRSNSHSVSKNRFVRRLLDQATKAVIEMDHVVQLMQHDSELKLRRLDSILLVMTIIGSVLFLLTVYFVYSRIVLPLDNSVRELRHTTENLEIEKALAEKANQAKSEFLSRMSHELRTPMNAILGFGQMLELDAKGFNETQRGNVKEILDAGQHLLILINEVLDLARIESGKLEISMEEVHVADALQQCISLIQPQAKARHIELTDHISSKGHAVQADFTRLKQVLVNFLSNAVKYNSEHGRITLASETIDKQRLRIRVTDTGKGLTEKEIAKLFTPFERLDNDSNVEGTGIGLVITKHLIELMGGTMGVDSTLGEGSSFWVELDLVHAPTTDT